MELRRRSLRGEILSPADGFARVSTEVELRFDPLTGQGSRVVAPRGLMPPNEFDLAALGEETAATCPFCAGRLEERTPRFPPEVVPDGDGRIRRGRAVCFPNLLSYGAFSSVSVYAVDLHLLRLGEITGALMADNLATQVAFVRAVQAADPAAGWASVNANHMLPSGSSLFHPHLQGLVDPEPTTMQRTSAGVPPERVRDYLDTERRLGERYVANTGRVEWVVSFAPIVPAELRAFIHGTGSPGDLDDDLVAELGTAIAAGLGLYADLGFESFNLALYGAPPGAEHVLDLRMGARSNLRTPGYRSDAMYLERLHLESAVDVVPESVTEPAKARFASLAG